MPWKRPPKSAHREVDAELLEGVGLEDLEAEDVEHACEILGPFYSRKWLPSNLFQ